MSSTRNLSAAGVLIAVAVALVLLTGCRVDADYTPEPPTTGQSPQPPEVPHA